ncbi:hypothetical protein ACHWQZ_G015740 [Mnemiopsis leidyi]
MIADLLNRRSLGSLTSLQEDSLSNFNDAFTIYGHPKVKDVLKPFELLHVIQLPNYRTALKLRAIQRKMQLHRVDARDIVAVMGDTELPPPFEEIGEAEMEPIINDVCLMAERNADTTIVSCADLILTWILQLFDSNYIGAVKVKQFTTAMVIMGAGRLLDKLKYLFDTFKDSDGTLTQQGFSELLTDLLLIPCSVFEEDIYGHSTLVVSAIFECFNQIGQERQTLSLEEFLQWCTKSPFSLSWLFAFHRLMSSEYSINLTSCSNCGVAPFLGFRYVALHRYSVAICQECLWTGNCEETEFREFGALSQCVNVTVVPMKTVGSATSAANSSTLVQVQQCLDRRHETLLNYSKRLDPSSNSHFVNLYETVNVKDDNVDALIGECEDRASKLQRDFHALSKEHSEILKLEWKDSELENFIAWKRRDDMCSRLAVWMSRRNDLYIKEESLLQCEEVALPTLTYRKFGALGSTQSLCHEEVETENNLHISMNGIDKIAPKVSVEDSVLVLSKLSLIINNALLQKSFSSTPSKPVKQISRDTPPISPLSFENKSCKLSNGSNGISKENIAFPTPTPKEEITMSTSEKDVMKEFEDTVNDIMIQENLMRPPVKIINLRPDSSKDLLVPPPLDTIIEVSPVAGKVQSKSPALGPLSSEMDFIEISPVQSECETKEKGEGRDGMKKIAELNVAPISETSGNQRNEPNRPQSPVESTKPIYKSIQMATNFPQSPVGSPKPRSRSTQVPTNFPQSPVGSPKPRSRSTQVPTNLPQSPVGSPKPRSRSTQVPTKKSLLPVLKTSSPVPSRQNSPASRIHVPSSRKVNPPEPTSVKPEITTGPDSVVSSPSVSSQVVMETKVEDHAVEVQDKEDEKEEAEENVQEENGEGADGGEDQSEEEEEWETEGSWETEDDNTERSQPPDTLNLQGVVSEPECDPPDLPEEDPEDCAPPIPPPRSLLSPQGLSQ